MVLVCKLDWQQQQQQQQLSLTACTLEKSILHEMKIKGKTNNNFVWKNLRQTSHSVKKIFLQKS